MVREPPHRTNDPEGMRGTILDVAATLFQTNGFNATSMKDLLAATGISAGALYHHYPTKKACALAVIRERVAPLMRETWVEPLRKAKSTELGVRTVLRDIAEKLDAAGRVQGCPLNNLALELSLADADYRAEIQAVFREWQTILVQKIKGDMSAGKLGKDTDPTLLATMIISAYSGAMTLSKTEQNSRPLRQCAKQLSSFFEQAKVA